ncbi:MAG: dimethyl sulfoxide reductase anchor subunit [Chloroflexi bacterium]|nr:dimethyl sulfoxide reductase anchor subunit [Chloroflexota bacterium]
MNVNPSHQKPWDWRASIQFICGGTGTGLLLFTALVALQIDSWLQRTGYLALVFLGIGLLSVFIKLGRRWRAMFVILNPRTSWMTREALLALPLFVLAGVGVLFTLPLVVLIAAVLGLGFLFAQAKMLESARGIPAWRTPLIVPLIVVTGLVEGGSIFVIATAVFDTVGLWMPITLLVLLALRLWIWQTYFKTLTTPGGAPIGTVTVLTDSRNTIIWVGHVAPLVLLAMGLVVPGGTAVLGALAGVAAIFGGWTMKFTIIARAAFNQGFALKHTPARTPGYGGAGTKPGWKIGE